MSKTTILEPTEGGKSALGKEEHKIQRKECKGTFRNENKIQIKKIRS